MLILMSIVTSIPVSSEAKETDEQTKVIFEADFNNDRVGEVPNGFTVSEEGGTVRVVETPNGENKSVFLDDTSNDKFVKLEKKLDDLEGIVTVEMKFMQPEYTSYAKMMRLKGDDNSVSIETNDGHLGYRYSDDTYFNLV